MKNAWISPRGRVIPVAYHSQFAVEQLAKMGVEWNEEAAQEEGQDPAFEATLTLQEHGWVRVIASSDLGVSISQLPTVAQFRAIAHQIDLADAAGAIVYVDLMGGKKIRSLVGTVFRPLRAAAVERAAREYYRTALGCIC